MADTKLIVLSLIGKGRQQNGNGKGYDKSKYVFLDERSKVYETAFFGSALVRKLRDQGRDIDKWIIFGTDTSSWSESLLCRL